MPNHSQVFAATLWLTTLSACGASPEETPPSTAQSPVKAPQASPVETDTDTQLTCGTVGNLAQVPLNVLQDQVPELETLSDKQQQQVAGFLNVVPAPCCACWESGHIAECLIEAPKGCENLDALKDRAIKAVQQDIPPKQLQSLLSYGDYWVPLKKGLKPSRLKSSRGLARSGRQQRSSVAKQIATLQQDFGIYPLSPFLRDFCIHVMLNRPAPARVSCLNRFEQQRRNSGMELATVLKMEQGYAQRSGVRSTPTWFINGYRLRGQQSPLLLSKPFCQNWEILPDGLKTSEPPGIEYLGSFEPSQKGRCTHLGPDRKGSPCGRPAKSVVTQGGP